MRQIVGTGGDRDHGGQKHGQRKRRTRVRRGCCLLLVISTLEDKHPNITITKGREIGPLPPRIGSFSTKVRVLKGVYVSERPTAASSVDDTIESSPILAAHTVSAATS